jgi:predicted transglutaminase-like cysteine proteinase
MRIFRAVHGLVALAVAASLISLPPAAEAAERVALPEAIETASIASAIAKHPLRATSPASSDAGEPFAASRPVDYGGLLWIKWHSVERAMTTEQSMIVHCRINPEACASPAARRFLAIVEAARTREGRARVGEINRAINLAIRPMSDLAQHGVPDVWSSPLATLTSGAGDCEDYAIAKFAALREVGFADDDLRLLVVRDPAAHEYHAVAAVRLDGQWLILDNRRMALVEAGHMTYEPLFSLRHQDAPVIAVAARPDDGRSGIVTGNATAGSPGAPSAAAAISPLPLLL